MDATRLTYLLHCYCGLLSIDLKLVVFTRQDKDLYTVGRGTNCDIVILQDMTKVKVDNPSRLHYGFRRVQESTDMSRIYLEDNSSNGTFVNGALVGKGNKKILSNGDKIYMDCEKGKFFTYLDPQQPKTGFPSKFNI